MEPDLTRNLPSVTESKQSSFLITLLSVLLLISVFIAGFFVYQTQMLVAELRVKNEELIIKIPTPIATIEPDPTVDWKTYTDNKLNISFKYPAEFALEKMENRVLVRIDPPRIETVEGICPRSVAFSVVSKDSVSKTTKNKYSCVYEAKIENDKIFIESQYWEGKNDINKQILSTFKFIESTTSNSPLPVACTMEAKICPDGSSVGRSGSKCEFSPCPTP